MVGLLADGDMQVHAYTCIQGRWHQVKPTGHTPQ